MEGIATAAGVASAERRPTAEVVPIGRRSADRSRARSAAPPVEPSAQPTGPRAGHGTTGPPHRGGSAAAAWAPETAPFGPSRCGSARNPLAPPPPDTVVVASPRHAIALEERARVREAALRAEHAAEVARLTVALRSMRAIHTAEIERLRAEHAAGLRRSVEANRQRETQRGRAQTAVARVGGPLWRQWPGFSICRREPAIGWRGSPDGAERRRRADYHPGPECRRPRSESRLCWPRPSEPAGGARRPPGVPSGRHLPRPSAR
jgi:hypothetical protein